MLTKINIALVLILILLSGYTIILNYEIHTLYHQNIKNNQEYERNKQINLQLKLEISEKTSNIFLDKFAKEQLQMSKPKKIHTLVE